MATTENNSSKNNSGTKFVLPNVIPEDKNKTVYKQNTVHKPTKSF